MQRPPRRLAPFPGILLLCATLLATSTSAIAMPDCPGIVKVDGISKVGIEGGQSCDASACPSGLGSLASVVADLCNIGVVPAECGVCECCRSDDAELWTGTSVTLAPGGDESSFCNIGGRGQAIGEAALCLLRDLAQPARAPSLGDPGIRLSAEVPLPVGTVTAQQKIGLLEFTNDAGGTRARVYHTTGYCLPGLGCIDGQTQTFTATLAEAAGGNATCGDFGYADPFKLDIQADEQQFNLGVGVGPILIPVPVGAISVSPRFDYESNQQAVTSPFAGGNDASRVEECTDTNYVDAKDATQVSAAAAIAGFGNLVQGWRSSVGIGGRDPSIDGPVWDPGSDPFPLRPDFDLSVARSFEEKRPATRFHGGLRLAYSLADILEALGIPASIPPFSLDDISVYVQTDVDAAIASQLHLEAYEDNPIQLPDCHAPALSAVRLDSRLATVAQLLVKAGFRMVFTIDLGLFEKTFRIEEEVPALSLTPPASVTSGPLASAAFSTDDAPVPAEEYSGLHTFSAPDPASGRTFVDDCLASPPPAPQSPPPASLSPGDPADLAAAVQVPCNICVYLPDVIVSACVPRAGVDPNHDCGLGVNGHACTDPDCEDRAVDPPVSANVQRVLNGASQAGLAADRRWACDSVAKNGCMDLCTFDPYAAQPLVVVQSAVDLKGALCRDGDGTFEPARPCVSAADCDDRNDGTADSCSGGGACENTPLDGTPCDDGLWCNGADTYVAGQCTAHAGNPCFAGGDCCLEDTDACVDHCPTSPCDGKAPGDACDDGSVCTVGDQCAATPAGLSCRGNEALSCSSSDPCMASLCEDVGGAPACVEHENGSCPRCGNDVLDAGEACDDGNQASGDGCDANCTATACGNGVVTAGESCDDGNAASGDGCDTNCTATACGNGVVAGTEQCDDGNATSGDGCDANCTTTACGNGVVAGTEQCDDGNAVPEDGCENDCTVTTCTSLVTTNCAVPHDHIAFAKEITGPHVVETVSQAEFLTRTDSEEAGYSCVEFGSPGQVVRRTVWYRYRAPVSGELHIDAGGSRLGDGPWMNFQQDYVVATYRAFTWHGGNAETCFILPETGGFTLSRRVEAGEDYMIVMGVPPYVELPPSESFLLELTLDPDPLVNTSNLHATRSGADIQLTWDDLSTDETGYRVFRRNGIYDFSPVELAALPQDAESYTDTGAGCGFREYQVQVAGPGVPGDFGGVLGQAVLVPPCTPPHDDIASAKVVTGASYTDTVTGAPGATIAPSDVPMDCAWMPDLQMQHTVWYRVSPASDATMTVDLAGTTGTTGWFTGIQVFRGTPGALTKVACANSSSEFVYSSVQDLALEGGEDYWVEVGYASYPAANYDITYHVSIALDGGDPPPPTPPSAPTALSAARGAGFGQQEVGLAWDDPNSDEDGYALEVTVDGGTNWDPVTTTAASATAFSSSNASCLASQYRVRAVRGAETSAWTLSNAVSACGPVTLPSDAVDCQATIVKAAGKYLAARLRALQDCRNDWNAGDSLFTDEDKTLPLADAEDCALEFHTAAALAKAGVKLRASIGKECSDAVVGSMAACADTVDGLVAAGGTGGCLVATAAASADDMIDDEYGRALTPAEPAARACQRGIAKAGAYFSSARSRAMATCVADLAKGEELFADKAKTIPVTTSSGCATEVGTAGKIAKAGANARKAIVKEECSDAVVTDLASTCALTVDGLVAADGASGCIIAGHAFAGDAALAASY